MRSEAREVINGWQIGRDAAQVMSRVSAMRTGERAAPKNDLLFRRSSETGTHVWKVALLRNELKKSGQDCDVKLLPRELSNGDGMGVATMLIEVFMLVVVVPVVVAVGDGDTSDVAK